MGVSVHERVDPRQLGVAVGTVQGASRRWGPDELAAEDTPAGISIATKMPGGFATFGCRLPRRGDVTYADLKRFAPVRVYGAGGSLTAFDGYLAGYPSSRAGGYAITPDAVGWAGVLKDNPSFAEIFVDQDRTRWQGPSTARSLALATLPRLFNDPSINTDETTGQPSLAQELEGAWSTLPQLEAYYDAGVSRIGSLAYAWTRGSPINSGDPNWTWAVTLADADTLIGGSNASGNLRAAGPGIGTLTATSSTRRFAELALVYSAAGGIQGTIYGIYWTMLAVYGTHGLTKQGAVTATSAPGFFADDIVVNVIQRAAAALSAATSLNGGSVVHDPFVIPQLAFYDPVDAATAIDEVNRYFLNDYGVYENRRFFWRPPAYGFDANCGFGREWHLRLSEGVQPDETGPTVDTAFNGVIVTYTDPTGLPKWVGPPGSGAYTTDASLQDTSSDNPVNAFGRTRWAHVDAQGVTTSGGAIQLGALFLKKCNSRQTAGQARVTGWARDDRGVDWPVWMMRAGDTVVFDDAADSTPRVIIDTTYDHDTLTCTCSLDAPPNKLDWLVQRLQLVISPLG